MRVLVQVARVRGRFFREAQGELVFGFAGGEAGDSRGQVCCAGGLVFGGGVESWGGAFVTEKFCGCQFLGLHG